AALDAEQVLVATDGYGHGLVPELTETSWPTRGQVIVSKPLDRVLYDKPHYARQGFDYWQQLPDGRVLLGGFRDVSILDELTDVEVTTDTIQRSLESFLEELLGEPPEVTHRWAGIFGLTQDLLPLVGRVPGRDGLWVAGGYSGHGNVLGFACGELVANAILGGSARGREMGMSEYLRRLREKIGHEFLLMPSAASLVRDDDGRILLVQHVEGRWQLPGGAVDPDERPEETACREAREEAGIELELLGLAGVFGGPEYRVTYANGDEAGWIVTVFN